jgi:hypothetical protein
VPTLKSTSHEKVLHENRVASGEVSQVARLAIDHKNQEPDRKEGPKY